MHDAVQLRVRQAARHITGNLQRGPLRDHPLAQHHPVKGFTVNKLHGKVVISPALARVDGLHDIRVVQLGGGPGLFAEPLDKGFVLREAGLENLDGDNTIDTDLSGAVDGAHAAPPHSG